MNVRCTLSAVLALALTAGAAAAVSTPPRVAIIDDAAAAEALLGHFDYVGHWQHVRNKHDGRLNGTSTRSTHTGDVAIVHFDGSRIRLYGVRGPSGGRAGIALDLESTGKPVDFYSPTVQTHSLIYQSPELPRGVHTLSIVVWGLRDARGRYYYVNIDCAQIELQPTAIGGAGRDPERTPHR